MRFSKHAARAGLFAVAVACLVLAGAAAAQQDDGTAAAVKARYAAFLGEYSRLMQSGSLDNVPGADEFAAQKNMLSRGLKELFKKDRECVERTGEVCKVDFDFLLNAQDYCQPLEVLDIAPKDAAYVLTVTNHFEKCQDPEGGRPYEFVLVKEAGEWVIDDARYVGEMDGKKQVFTLKEMLR